MSTDECLMALNCAKEKDEMTVWTLNSGLLGIRVHEFNGGTYGVNLSVEDVRKLSDCLNLWAMIREQAE